MSLQSDIVTALSSVASGKVFPQFVNADIDPPFVVYKITSKDPLQTIDGTIHQRNSTAAFECYAENYNDALTLADAVRSAIEGSAPLNDGSVVQYEDTSPGEDYIPAVDIFMEPVYFGFWYT